MNYLTDVIVIVVGLLFAWIFSYLWTEKLYRFYFGIILWFLLFLVFNLQIKLASGALDIDVLSGWDRFLLAYKETLLGFWAIMIPIFWFLFAFIDSELKSNKLFSILFGFFLPLFILGIFGYILLHSSVELGILKEILWVFGDSKIFETLQKAPKLIFGLLLIIIFWKYIFAMILSFLGYISKLIAAEIKELRWEKQKEQKEESKRIKLH